ncbi:MAG: cytochrome C [Candidatus Hydrogenedentes bacterium]|nr:cytochrome C [Candidatus Hydrogenedentota bacterium]
MREKIAYLARIVLRYQIISVAALCIVAAAAVEPPAIVEDPASCGTADCHPGVKDHKYLHAPARLDACTMCHEQVENKHEFLAIPSMPELCLSCHEAVTDSPIVHAPVLEDCTQCHDPHGSSQKMMLAFSDQKEMCFQCHDDSIMENEFKHGPASVGACTICHAPHSSKEEKLLREPTRDLWALCHGDLMEEMESAVHLHEPLKEGCTSCHNPHSGPGPRMLPGTTKEVCGQCHEDVVNVAINSTVRHGPMATEDACLHCHSAHSSSRAPLLKKAQIDLCLSCHDKEVQAPEATLQNMKVLLDKNSDWHGPIKTGNCDGCHLPHGGENFRMLKLTYPKKFYSPFDMAYYELCFSCHDPELVKRKETKTLTNFRDGKRNLHYVHVNKEERGRTCRACHEVHASSQRGHIRESVPYGKWDLPINFKKTKGGGSCQPGCHEEASYDRIFLDKSAGRTVPKLQVEQK